MGPLAYQAMPSLRDPAHDGWFVHLLYYSSFKFHQLAAGQFLSGQPVRYGKGRQYGLARPSRTKSDLTGHSPPAGQAGRRVVPAL
jgi:hypothetical protein